MERGGKPGPDARTPDSRNGARRFTSVDERMLITLKPLPEVHGGLPRDGMRRVLGAARRMSDQGENGYASGSSPAVHGSGGNDMEVTRWRP